jgi:type I restriction enzyme R subunit
VLFSDPTFDGDPVQIYEPKDGQPVVPPDEEPVPEHPETPDGGQPLPDGDEDGTAARPRRYFVNNVEVTVATERVQYLDENGRLITESLKDYSRKTVRQTYTSLDDFLTVWNGADRKQVILEELAAKGVFLDELAAQVGPDIDVFDLICHVAFDQKPLTRRERADRVKKRDVFARYGAKARAVLAALIEKYADTDILSVESLGILKIDPLTHFGTPMEILQYFGGKPAYLAAIRELETELYREVA